MEYTVQEETMQAIADAIRERSETSDPILTSDMPSLILTLKAKWGEITGNIEDQVDLNELFAKVNGYYEDMSVGSAEQLLSNMFEDDSTPYLYRTSGGSLEIGDRVYEDAIVGGSVAWNQLVQNGDFSSSTGWVNNGVDLSVDNNKAIATRTDVGSGSSIHRQNINYLANHKYLVSVTVMPSANTTKTRVRIYGDSDHATFGASNAIASNTRKTISEIINPNFSSASGRIYLYFDSDGGTVGDTYDVENFMLIDLTLALGQAIADYAYTLEQATANSGIAWLKSQGFFTKDYYAYNAGGIKSVKTSAKKVVGFNQWDEQWELGFLDSSTGQPIANSTRFRAKNFTKVFPSTTYYVFCGNNEENYVYRYDANQNYLGRNLVRNNTIGIPENTHYIKIAVVGATTYNNDICINIHWDGERDGEYEAYEEHTYPLDADLELRGIPKLVDGKIKYDGDIYASDGTVTRRYGIVDLGTLTWNKSESISGGFYATMQGYKWANDTKMICGKYYFAGNAYGAGTYFTIDKAFKYFYVSSTTSAREIYIYDTSYSTASASDFKTAMSGVYLVYELATPTTESADPYTNPQLIDNWGTEEFVDERDVPVPVGHESRYLPDLKAKVESAPNNPSTNGKYFLQYENGQATYVPVPSEIPQTPSEDGTYVLKATVSSGTATLAWMAEE